MYPQFEISRKKTKLILDWVNEQYYTGEFESLWWVEIYQTVGETVGVSVWTKCKTTIISSIGLWTTYLKFGIQPSPSWLFRARSHGIWTRQWSWGDVLRIWLRTRGHTAVATCQSQRSHALKDTQLCLFYLKWTIIYEVNIMTSRFYSFVPIAKVLKWNIPIGQRFWNIQYERKKGTWFSLKITITKPKS